MKGKVLLIRPHNVYNYNNYPALGLISVASVLRSSGYEVRIINSAFEKDHLKTIERELEGALFAGITLLTSEVPDAWRIMKLIKQVSDVPVVAGGWHCTLFPGQMANSGLVDYVVQGEGEEHIAGIASLLCEGAGGAQNVYAKKTLDMDALPVPDYGADDSIERFINGYLTDKLSEVVRQPMRWLPYESSRGCPSQCTFCINVVADNTRYRKKSADKVLSEIEYLVRRYRLTHLKIIDDNFFVDIKRVRAVCEGIARMGLDITWDGECRCDYFRERLLDDETLRLCRRSGLVQLTLGIESGSPHTLSLMKKGITPEQAEYAVMKCNEHGIIARSSFILEVPGERLEDIKKTIALINRLRAYPYFTCGVGTFRPYPKCELTEALVRDGKLTEPASFEEWTKQDVIDMYTSAEYKRPWQRNAEYAESAAFYLNMESAVRLGNYQIERKADRIKNSVFTAVAALRNRANFYGLTIDKGMYKKFLVEFYRKRQELEKSGAYPLSKMDGPGEG